MKDLKGLRIGSHYYNTNYVEPIIGRLVGLHTDPHDPECSDVVLRYDLPLDEDTDPFEGSSVHYLEPIPITPELLTELGFKIIQTIHAGCVKCTKGDITLSNYYTDKNWELEIDSDVHHSVYVCTNIRHLHELENFVYLTLGKELIDE